ncbi:MAG: FIST N-terminal domain-containing protein [Chloroflexota bacterium]|nr:FIST N-terminal domain-containing protein [Chloroflexota bacterium]
MLKAGVCWSDLADAYQAGQQSAQKALADLKGKADFALAFCTVDYDEAAFLKGIQETVRNVPLMGCTSFTGIITPGGFIHKEGGVGGVLLLSSPEMKFGVGGSEIGDDPRAAGQKAARAAIAQAGKTESDVASAFVMIAPPGVEETLIKGIEDVIGRAPMIGGSAADNTIEGYWKEFANYEVYANGVMVGVLYSELPFGTHYTGYYKPTAKQGLITKVEGKRTLVEIDGQKALEVYAGWRGMQVEDLLGGKLLSAAIPFPLGVRDVSGDLWWIRHPLGGNEDGSIAVGNDMAEGTAVTMMEATLDEIVQGASEMVKLALDDLDGEPGAAFIVHCGGRAAALGPERMDQVAADIKAVLGNVPFIGFCSFGEYGYAKWTANSAGGLMLAALVLGK